MEQLNALYFDPAGYCQEWLSFLELISTKQLEIICVELGQCKVNSDLPNKESFYT